MPDETQKNSDFEFARGLINLGGVAIVIGMIVVIIAAIVVGS